MIRHEDAESPSGYRYELTQEEHDAGKVAFLTGPIAGMVSLPDNTAAYDVSEDWIAVQREHVGHLHIAIHEAHHEAGRYLETPVPALEDVSLPPA